MKQLRIMQVASSLGGWGGLEFHILRLARALIDRGHNVCVVCRADSFIETQATAMGVPVLHGSIRKHEDFRELPYFRKLMREFQPDVVHVHGDNDAIVPTLAARLEGVRATFLTRHLPVDIKRLFRTFLVNDRLCDRIIAVSDFIRGRLVTQGLNERSVVTIYNAADAVELADDGSLDQIRAEFGVATDELFVGMVGRLDPEKGMADFVDAIALVKDLPVKAIIVGGGGEEENLRGRIAQRGMQERITMVGFREDAKKIMAALDIFVLASTWDEPFATVVLEAMLLGKPVIGTRTGGTPEQVIDGETGILVAPGSPEQIAAAIAQFANDPTLRIAMGAAGHARASETFTVSVMAERVEALYAEILNAERS